MERMESLLCEAAVEGNIATLLQLLEQDRLILEKVVMNRLHDTPLHVAAIRGHLDFAKEILNRMPELAGELDSRRSSPLHMAAQKGYIKIVKELLLVNADMCFARDVEGRNPLHLAAMKGRIEALVELFRARPLAAYATTIWGETVLHLCVKHNQLEALKFLVEIMDDRDSLNATDGYGMSILHLAVADKQIETINYLLANKSIQVNALNTHGYTALDILAQSRRDVKDLDIADSLRGAGALKAMEIQASQYWNNIGSVRKRIVPFVPHDDQNKALPRESLNLQQNNKTEDWLTRKRDALMVVASLIATMAFQSGVNPPGGLWQDDYPGGDSQNNNNKTDAHQAGTSIIAYKYESEYAEFLASNTAGFIASLSIILLLITGLPFKRRFFMWVLTVTIWIAITSMTVTYRVSILVFTPKEDERTVTQVIEYGVKVWNAVMALLLVGHTIRLSKKFKFGRKRRSWPLSYLYSTNH